MKIDTHTHTSGVSFCSTVPPEELVRLYKQAGYDGVVLTNHYNRLYMFRYGDTWEKQIRIYLDEYRETKRCGDRAGLKVFLGAEVALSLPDNPYVEFLLYGGDETFFLQSPRLYDCSQKSLYEICHDSGVLVYQSHPFRVEQGHSPRDPRYLDGTEINCHAHFLRREEDVRAFADRNDLGLVCGSDFHYAAQAGSAATYIDDAVETEQDLAAFLRQNKRPAVFYR